MYIVTLPLILAFAEQAAQTSLFKGAFLLLTYLFASIPFGYLFVRRSRHIDLRTVGSRNIGATNAFRAGGKLIGLGTLAADVGKGALPVWLSGWLFLEEPFWRAICAGAAVLGHCFPIYLAFRGGKGVATGFGALFPLIPLSVALALPLLCLILVTTRIMAVGTLIAIFSLPLFTSFLYPETPLFLVTSLGIGILILIRHKTNLIRLWKGAEGELFGDDGSAEPLGNHQDNF